MKFNAHMIVYTIIHPPAYTSHAHTCSQHFIVCAHVGNEFITLIYRMHLITLPQSLGYKLGTIISS